MTRQQRIKAIQTSLSAIEASLSQLQAALQVASNLRDVARLNNEIVSLKARRTQLQFELVNLQAADATAAARVKQPKISRAESTEVLKLSKELGQTLSDRRVVDAALTQSEEVMGRVTRIQSVLGGGNTTKDDDWS